MLLDLQGRLKDLLRVTIRAQWNIEPPDVVLTQTPKIELGELATPIAFELARLLKRSPRAIAEELILRTGKIDGVERMEPAGTAQRPTPRHDSGSVEYRASQCDAE